MSETGSKQYPLLGSVIDILWMETRILYAGVRKEFRQPIGYLGEVLRHSLVVLG